MAGNISFILFLGLVSVALAVNFKTCPNVDKDKCSISDVRINPCAGKECKIKLGESAAISFDFTPNFPASKLMTGVYYKGVSFPGVNSDGCQYTGCPVEPGKQQTFDYNLEVGKKLPPGSYEIHWKVWNEDDEDDLCCFRTKIKLLK